jgi:cytochrome c peroxidase
VRWSLLLACLAFAWPALAQPVLFTTQEHDAILAHGPWPPDMPPDPSNRVSGKAGAIAFGRTLFFNTRLSESKDLSCASCHDPARAFADAKPRSIGIAPVDRNSIALANLRLNRWFGWDGKSDSLWAQSIHPILDRRELGATAELIAGRVADSADLRAAYNSVFGTKLDGARPEAVLVDLAKALAAYQETLITPPTAFDRFRDALETDDRAGIAAFPEAAKRGLRLFLGRGNCALCHSGPNFTNGEFHDVGISHFAAPGRVDPGRHGGIAVMRASPFNLLGPYSDDAARGTAAPTLFVEPLHRNWGEFRVPSLRNVGATGPYMHDGSLPDLVTVAQHYSDIPEERLHADGERLLVPLRLSADEIADLLAFLRSLDGDPRERR